MPNLGCPIDGTHKVLGGEGVSLIQTQVGTWNVNIGICALCGNVYTWYREQVNDPVANPATIPSAVTIPTTNTATATSVPATDPTAA